MTASSLTACACEHLGGSRAAAPAPEVLAAVVEALGAAGQGDWLLLEAWVSAVTLVTSAALQAVPEELHDFL